MLSRILYYIIALMMAIYTPLDAQQYYTDSLNILCVKDVKLKAIIDSIIIHKNYSKDFSHDRTVVIDCRDSEDFAVLQISSIGSDLYQMNNERGCFTYGEHSFIVTGQLMNNLFKVTDKKETIRFKKIGKFPDVPREDDSGPFRTFIYVNDDYYLFEGNSSCSDDSCSIYPLIVQRRNIKEKIEENKECIYRNNFKDTLNVWILFNVDREGNTLNINVKYRKRNDCFLLEPITSSLTALFRDSIKWPSSQCRPQNVKMITMLTIYPKFAPTNRILTDR